VTEDSGMLRTFILCEKLCCANDARFLAAAVTQGIFFVAQQGKAFCERPFALG